MQTTQTATPATASPAIWTIGPNAWKARSKSHPNAAHTIRKNADGYSCSCPARVKCWHIREVETMEAPKPAQSVVDPSDFDADPFGDLEIPAPKAAPVALPEAHKPTLAELEDLFTYFS